MSATKLLVVLCVAGIICSIHRFFIISGLASRIFGESSQVIASSQDGSNEMEQRLEVMYGEIYGPVQNRVESETTRTWLWLIFVFAINVIVLQLEMAQFQDISDEIDKGGH
jgi:hypothetical protein